MTDLVATQEVLAARESDVSVHGGALHWVLQVDVAVLLIQETTVHETPEVQIVERRPFISKTPVAMVCCVRDVHSRRW